MVQPSSTTDDRRTGPLIDAYGEDGLLRPYVAQGVIVLNPDGSIPSASPATPNIQGNVANGASDTGTNPVKIGGVYSSTGNITSLTAGNRGDAQMDVSGNLRAAVTGVAVTPSNTGATYLLGYSRSTNSVTTANAAPLAVGGYVWNGTNTFPMAGDANAVAMQPAITANFWNYAAANLGIVNTTTPVTLKAAAGAGIRNYIEAIQLDWEAFGTASEVAIRDGSAGTVLWRMKIGTGSAGNRVITFRPALRGTANTLLEIVTLTASVTGALYVNAQGWTGV